MHSLHRCTSQVSVWVSVSSFPPSGARRQELGLWVLLSCAGAGSFRFAGPHWFLNSISSSAMSDGELEISRGRRVYTTEISKHAKSSFSHFFGEGVGGGYGLTYTATPLG